MAFTKSKKEKLPSLEEFLTSTKGSRYAPVYLFVGEEDFLIEECTRRVVGDLLTADTKAFNFDTVYGGSVEVRDVLALAASYPMMSDRRVVIVKDFEKLVTTEQSKSLFSAYLAKPMESTCLILIAATPDFRSKPFHDLKKLGSTFGFMPLYDNQVPAWIHKHTTHLGYAMDEEGEALLQTYVGNSLRALHNELQKVFLSIGERKTITAADVAEVVGVSKGFTIFDLQNAIGKRDSKEALHILCRMLEAGESPVMMIVMLTKYFTVLWKVQTLLRSGATEQKIAEEAKLAPFFVKNYVQATRKYSEEEICNAFHAMVDVDVQLKSASPDPYHIMELLLVTIMLHPSSDAASVIAA